MNYRGPIPEDLWEVLQATHKKPLALQGDYARQHAQTVAMAASMGLISIISPDGSGLHHHWRLTAAGITALAHKEHLE